ncbi:hypothetical protein D9V96_016875 [Zobellia laminariae]|uniref:hypothetical protein n=1 Tax=Zobellia laminariae TaxID=248906 RepID=UPI0012D99538|nr:hypothetical protein [Zobellia laminariae]
MNKESSINYEQILLKDPLFTEYILNDVDRMELLNLLFYADDKDAYNNLKIIDSYCTICKKHTTFNSEDSSQIDQQELSDLLMSAGMYSGFPGDERKITLIEELEKKCIFIRKFNCPRKPNDSAHSQIFVFRVIGTTMIKIGQHPTLADLSKEGLKKYRKLNDEIYSELNRAVGLSTHGIGIGSFVYLRRIIEKHIVYPAIKELVADGKLTNEQISKSDFKEKIKLAKDKLPAFLVENGKIYSVLSKGIHELDEDECKGYFPILRTAIEIVLDEQIDKKERAKKNKLISDQLNKIN